MVCWGFFICIYTLKTPIKRSGCKLAKQELISCINKYRCNGNCYNFSFGLITEVPIQLDRRNTSSNLAILNTFARTECPCLCPQKQATKPTNLDNSNLTILLVNVELSLYFISLFLRKSRNFQNGCNICHKFKTKYVGLSREQEGKNGSTVDQFASFYVVFLCDRRDKQ